MSKSKLNIGHAAAPAITTPFFEQRRPHSCQENLNDNFELQLQMTAETEKHRRERQKLLDVIEKLRAKKDAKSFDLQRNNSNAIVKLELTDTIEESFREPYVIASSKKLLIKNEIKRSPKVPAKVLKNDEETICEFLKEYEKPGIKEEITVSDYSLTYPQIKLFKLKESKKGTLVHDEEDDGDALISERQNFKADKRQKQISAGVKRNKNQQISRAKRKKNMSTVQTTRNLVQDSKAKQMLCLQNKFEKIFSEGKTNSSSDSNSYDYNATRLSSSSASLSWNDTSSELSNTTNLIATNTSFLNTTIETSKGASVRAAKANSDITIASITLPYYTTSLSRNEASASSNKTKLILKNPASNTVTSTNNANVTSKRSRGRPAKSHSDRPDPSKLNGLSDTERQYVINRAKNNEASRLSRLKRQAKVKALEIEESQLNEKNKKLKSQLMSIESIEKKLEKALKKFHSELS